MKPTSIQFLIIILSIATSCFASQPRITLSMHQLAQHPETRQALQQAQINVARIIWKTGIEDQSTITDLINEHIETFKDTLATLQKNLQQEHDFAQDDLYVIRKIKEAAKNPELAHARALSHINFSLKEYLALYPDNAVPFLVWKQNFLKQIPRDIKEMVRQNLEKQAENINDTRAILHQAFPQNRDLIDNLSPATPYDPTIQNLLKDISKREAHDYIGILTALSDVIHEPVEDLETLVKIMKLQREQQQDAAKSCASAYAAARFAGYDRLDKIPKEALKAWGKSFLNKIPAGGAREIFTKTMNEIIDRAEKPTQK